MSQGASKASAETTASGIRAKTSYHHGDLAAQLIAAASEWIAAHGQEGFSVSEAARRAGVSSAAPYKHFKDRDAILVGVAAAAMDRLAANMKEAADQYPVGSLEAVAAVGQAYIDFARFETGLFRLAFGSAQGQEEAPELLDSGRRCFAVLVDSTARYLGPACEREQVEQRAYLLWSFVHGHAFLTIDCKNKASRTRDQDWDFLLEVGRSILR